MSIRYREHINRLKDRYANYKNSANYVPTLNGHIEKLDEGNNLGYKEWLKSLIQFFKETTKENNMRVLDLGCGTGEMTILLKSIGVEAYGIDVLQDDVNLAKELAIDNNIDPDIFFHSSGKTLPFADDHFDLVTMFSVLEHIEDAVLTPLLGELSRVCKGPIFILVPNRFKIRDDHTGWPLLGFIPRVLVEFILNVSGNKNLYFMSKSCVWDVFLRSEIRIKKLANLAGYELLEMPDNLIFPRKNDEVKGIGKRISEFKKEFFFGIPFPVAIIKKGTNLNQFFRSYLNIYMSKK